MFITENILLILLFLPLLGISLLLLIPSNNKLILKTTALFFSGIIFIFSLFLWLWFDSSVGIVQFVNKVLWLPFLNFNLTLGIDGISLFFLLLSTLLTFLCILISWNSITFNIKYYLISFLLMEFFFNRSFLCFRFIIILYFF